jgi:hypothetical protein
MNYSHKKDCSKRISTCWFGDAFRGGWTWSEGAPKRRNEPDKTELGNHQTRELYLIPAPNARDKGDPNRHFPSGKLSEILLMIYRTSSRRLDRFQ